MKYFHLQEALARFGLGAIFISGLSFFICKKVIKDYLLELEKEGLSSSKANLISKVPITSNSITNSISQNDQDEEDENSLLQEKNLIALSEYSMNKEKVYDLDDTIERKNRVENYLNNKK
jgi:hypothetical protein